ncbi:hypothetical protein ADUPG1_011935 [Aduncisulcus paluster]|uniref:Uncharacterized protein n=1 Tax=Aduncisulcus paluster TaxID=2918883 RepID=A0ABQ5K2J6_9EUKA|nr:hypothetical protein ADUPG1_011935 [Aduncisulcus paluster]
MKFSADSRFVIIQIFQKQLLSFVVVDLELGLKHEIIPESTPTDMFAISGITPQKGRQSVSILYYSTDNFVICLDLSNSILWKEPLKEVTAICVTCPPLSTILVGTKRGLYYFDSDSHKFVYLVRFNTYIKHLVPSPANQYFIVSSLKEGEDISSDTWYSEEKKKRHASASEIDGVLSPDDISSVIDAPFLLPEKQPLYVVSIFCLFARIHMDFFTTTSEQCPVFSPNGRVFATCSSDDVPVIFLYHSPRSECENAYFDYVYSASSSKSMGIMDYSGSFTNLSMYYYPLSDGSGTSLVSFETPPVRECVVSNPYLTSIGDLLKDNTGPILSTFLPIRGKEFMYLHCMFNSQGKDFCHSLMYIAPSWGEIYFFLHKLGTHMIILPGKSLVKDTTQMVKKIEGKKEEEEEREELSFSSFFSAKVHEIARCYPEPKYSRVKLVLETIVHSSLYLIETLRIMNGKGANHLTLISSNSPVKGKQEQMNRNAIDLMKRREMKGRGQKEKEEEEEEEERRAKVYYKDISKERGRGKGRAFADYEQTLTMIESPEQDVILEVCMEFQLEMLFSCDEDNDDHKRQLKSKFGFITNIDERYHIFGEQEMRVGRKRRYHSKNRDIELFFDDSM